MSRPPIVDIATSRRVTRRIAAGIRWHEEQEVDDEQLLVLHVYVVTVTLDAVLAAAARAGDAQRAVLEHWALWMLTGGVTSASHVIAAPNVGLVRQSIMARFAADQPSEVPDCQVREIPAQHLDGTP